MPLIGCPFAPVMIRGAIAGVKPRAIAVAEPPPPPPAACPPPDEAPTVPGQGLSRSAHSADRQVHFASINRCVAELPGEKLDVADRDGISVVRIGNGAGQLPHREIAVVHPESDAVDAVRVETAAREPPKAALR